MKPTLIHACVFVAAAILATPANAARARPPSTAERCAVAADFLRDAKAQHLISDSWSLDPMPNPDEAFRWSRDGRWEGQRPPADTALTRATPIATSDGLAACSTLKAQATRLGASDGDATAGAISVSLPLVSPDGREAILHWVSAANLARTGVLSSADCLAYLRRDRHGHWRLAGHHLMGD